MPHPFDVAPIAEQIWREKYRFDGTDGLPADATVSDTWRRVANAAASVEATADARALWSEKFVEIMQDFVFLPGGRILAGAGTGRRVTLFNCFVLGSIPDTLDGIFNANREAALTMQQGGGIGHDFSTLRPRGAALKATGAKASGPVSFMEIWDAMCRTVMSAGARRGAMMGTLRCDHPDIVDFIDAKRTPGRLTNFNLSVLVTDEFIEAVRRDGDWQLQFGGQVYETVKARSLWQRIMQSTYEHAEPGVIFIDRVNALNNLGYCEQIAATNPCGEQPLPPYGACLLGAINLARLICSPFSDAARIDRERLIDHVKTAVRLLDNVIDLSEYPLASQRDEALSKRRIGLGVTGLANALSMCGARYGSELAVQLTDGWLRTLKLAAYEASIELAREKGAFPAFEADAFLTSPNVQSLPQDLRDRIAIDGVRNGCLTTIAPTGTISLLAGNVSSGIEPTFARHYQRRVLREDGSHETVEVTDYAAELHQAINASAIPNDIQPGIEDLRPTDHIRMQTVAQRHIDSAISKTVNCPETLSFEAFHSIYVDAFDAGLKGCTTYRPNPTTGAVLAKSEDTRPQETPISTTSPASVPEPAETVASKRAHGDGQEQGRRLGAELHHAEPSYAPNVINFNGRRRSGTAQSNETVISSDAVIGGKGATSSAHLVRTPLPAHSSAAAIETAAIARRRASTTYKIHVPSTDKIHVPGTDATIHVVIDSDRKERQLRPAQLLLIADDPADQVWLTGLAKVASALLERDGNLAAVAATLRVPRAQSQRTATALAPTHERAEGSPTDRVCAILQHIAAILENHASEEIDDARDEAEIGRGIARGSYNGGGSVGTVAGPDACPNCNQKTRIRLEGCWVCRSCGAAACG